MCCKHDVLSEETTVLQVKECACGTKESKEGEIPI
jgi:hypothetical protein